MGRGGGGNNDFKIYHSTSVDRVDKTEGQLIRAGGKFRLITGRMPGYQTGSNLCQLKLSLQSNLDCPHVSENNGQILLAER